MADILWGAGYIGVKSGTTYPYTMRCLVNFSQIEINCSEEGGEELKALRLGGSIVVATTPGVEKWEVKVSNIDFVVPALEVLLNTQANASASNQFPWNEVYTVPTTPFEVTIPAALTADTEYAIDVETWEQFTRVGAAPSAGEFMISGTTVTFNTADTGKDVLIGGYQSVTSRILGGTSAPSVGAVEVAFYAVTNQNKKVGFVFPECTPKKDLSLVISEAAAELPINFNVGTPSGWAKPYKLILE